MRPASCSLRQSSATTWSALARILLRTSLVMPMICRHPGSLNPIAASSVLWAACLAGRNEDGAAYKPKRAVLFHERGEIRNRFSSLRLATLAQAY